MLNPPEEGYCNVRRTGVTHQLTTDFDARWTAQGSNPVRGKIFPRPLERPDRPRGPPSLIFGRSRYSFAGKGGARDVKLSTHLCLDLRLRISGAKPPRTLYSFMVCTRRTTFGFTTEDGENCTSTTKSCRRLQCITGWGGIIRRIKWVYMSTPRRHTEGADI